MLHFPQLDGLLSKRKDWVLYIPSYGAAAILCCQINFVVIDHIISRTWKQASHFRGCQLPKTKKEDITLNSKFR